MPPRGNLPTTAMAVGLLLLVCAGIIAFVLVWNNPKMNIQYTAQFSSGVTAQGVAIDYFTPEFYEISWREEESGISTGETLIVIVNDEELRATELTDLTMKRLGGESHPWPYDSTLWSLTVGDCKIASWTHHGRVIAAAYTYAGGSERRRCEEIALVWNGNRCSLPLTKDQLVKVFGRKYKMSKSRDPLQ